MMFSVINGQKYKIYWKHTKNIVPSSREGIDQFTGKQKMTVKGGTTTCYIVPVNKLPGIVTSSLKTYIGSSKCGPTDMFNKAIGRKISLIRALRNMGINKEVRATIMNQYFERLKV